MIAPDEEAVGEDAGEGINISPLIDIVFILLLFFIVTTVFVQETGIEVEKPKASQSQSLDENSILIGVNANGQVFYAGKEIGVQGVAPLLDRIFAGTNKMVIIQADGQTSTARLVEVIDEAKRAGVERVNISTRNE